MASFFSQDGVPETTPGGRLSDRFFAEKVPTAAGGRDQADLFNMDSQGDRDLVCVPQIRISTLDPSSSAGVGTKVGMDATAPVGSLERAFKSIAIPGYEKIDLKEYR